jgi:hypothetical protein
VDLSAFLALKLFRLAQVVNVQTSEPVIRSELSGVSYLILTAVLLIVIGGLGWCFYRALLAAGGSEEKQYPSRRA